MTEYSSKEKKQLSFLIKLYSKILIVGWLLAVIDYLISNKIFIFIYFTIILLAYNSYVMLKYNYLLIEGSGPGALLYLWLGIYLNKSLKKPNHKFNVILGIIFSLIAVSGLLITILIHNNLI